jgi:hypothetical protein
MKHSEETRLKIKNKLKELVRLNPDKFTSSKKEKKILHCVECNEKMYLRPSDKKKFCSLQCKDLARDKGFFKGKSGGMRIGAGRAKSGWYKGIFCNSSYELAWVIYSLDNNVKFKRNTKGFEYLNTEGYISNYYPDFYIENEETYIEIKGYKEKEFENKQKYFTEKILVVDKNKIKPIINYVESKYGKNFIELYERNPHKVKNNKCLCCGEPAKFQYCSRICSGKGVRKLKDYLDYKPNTR